MAKAWVGRACMSNTARGHQAARMIRSSLSGLATRSLFVRCSFVPYRSYSPPQLYSSVEEHPEAVEGKIHGTIPPWLSGRLIRNGPGLFEVGDTKYNHLFDGLSLLHSFTVDQGKVWYQSRFLRSESYKKNVAANRIVVSEFGTVAHPDPCKTLFQRMSSLYQKLRNPGEGGTDNCVVNVIPIGDELIAATETDYVHQIDSKTLDSVKRHQLSNNVAVNGATAHAHWDTDGTVYNLGNSYADGAMYNVIKILPPNQGGELFSRSSVLSSIPAKDKLAPGYYHSFGLTENYIVFMEQPLKIELRKYHMLILLGKPFNGMLNWKPEENVRFYVIEKASGRVVDTHYTSPACLVFHHINAYEEDGHIVVDVCALEDGGVAEVTLDSLGQSRSPGFQPKSRRYVLPLGGSNEDSNLVTLKTTKASATKQNDGSILCTHEELCSVPFDFPQINYNDFNGRRYNFAYGVTMEKSLLDDADILKLDVSNGATKRWSKTDCAPSEPVFVPHPEAQNEDDGVILSAVLHKERKAAPFLLVLDAKTMDEVGRVEFEGIQMHKDFHGIFQHL